MLYVQKYIVVLTSSFFAKQLIVDQANIPLFKFQEGLGLRIHSIHVLNANSLLQHLVSFMRQFFSPKIIDRVIVHESLDALHMSLPKRYLPKDYGGDEPALAEFRGKNLS